MRMAREVCHRGWSESIIIGARRRPGDRDTYPLVTRVRRGAAFGGVRRRTDLPQIVGWSMEGKIEIAR
jgi:S-(hydroxymethyl)glutathione dehydrogenase / alcohol dehydrogenase